MIAEEGDNSKEMRVEGRRQIFWLSIFFNAIVVIVVCGHRLGGQERGGKVGNSNGQDESGMRWISLQG